MNFTLDTMINNSVKLAYYKLNQHKELGVKSKLNVFEVAELMDTVKRGDSVKQQHQTSIFYNIHSN